MMRRRTSLATTLLMFAVLTFGAPAAAAQSAAVGPEGTQLDTATRAALGISEEPAAVTWFVVELTGSVCADPLSVREVMFPKESYAYDCT